MLRAAIARLRTRQVFHESFIDAVVRRFEARQQTVRTPMSALVSVDVMLELGILQP
jgi:hypothetical protein